MTTFKGTTICAVKKNGIRFDSRILISLRKNTSLSEKTRSNIRQTKTIPRKIRGTLSVSSSRQLFVAVQCVYVVFHIAYRPRDVIRASFVFIPAFNSRQNSEIAVHGLKILVMQGNIPRKRAAHRRFRRHRLG